jgi:hypothetical protein
MVDLYNSRLEATGLIQPIPNNQHEIWENERNPPSISKKKKKFFIGRMDMKKF